MILNGEQKKKKMMKL